MYICSYSSPLGEITLASNGHTLTGLWFVGQKYYGETMDGDHAVSVVTEQPPNGDSAEKVVTAQPQSTDGAEKIYPVPRKSGNGAKRPVPNLQKEADCETLSVFQQTIRWLDIYFSGKELDFMPEILPSGTPFQMEVWEILKTIPYGHTTTYGAIAAQIAAKRGAGSRMSAQAVGGAVSRNPVSILVPCHRVVGASGSLTGYAGGMARKTSLLKMEGVDMAALFSPRRMV